MNKPLGPQAHCAIDYGLTAVQFAAPKVFGLTGAARTLCSILGPSSGTTNFLLTNYGAP